MAKRAPAGKAARGRISAKISHLAKKEPEMPPKQRVAVAINMEREHRLGPKGAYKPVRKKGK